MNESLSKEAIIPVACYGERVDAALAKLFTEFSRSQLTLWLKAGKITINGRLYKPKEKIYGGEKVLLQLNDVVNHYEEDAAEAIPLEIVFEDDDILIINKPAGLVVHPGAGNPLHTLVNALLHHDPILQQLPRAGIIHRLDKDTTGLLMVAKNLPAHTSLTRQMQAREIQRRYLTLVYGHVISGGVLETFYGRHPRNRLKMAVCNQGKEAITEYTVKKHYHQFTLLEVSLLTGRTHQIRVHMAYMNHPVVGDQLYGGRVRFPADATDEMRQLLQTFKRQALHAYSLSLLHPKTQEYMNFEAPLPEDFQKLLQTLEHYYG